MTEWAPATYISNLMAESWTKLYLEVLATKDAHKCVTCGAPQWGKGDCCMTLENFYAPEKKKK